MQREGCIHGFEPVVLDPELLVAGPLPQELPQRKLQRAERNTNLAIAEQVGVGESDGKLVILVTDGRTEEERPAPFQFQQQTREIAGPLVVQPFLAEATRLDVAVVIEDAKHVAVLEDAGPFVGETRCSQDAKRAAVGLGDRCHLLRPRSVLAGSGRGLLRARRSLETAHRGTPRASESTLRRSQTASSSFGSIFRGALGIALDS